jgi:hypothetical protein
MNRLIPIFSCFFFLLYSGLSFGQSDELSYNEEFIYGVNFNTNGGLIGGVDFKWARAKGKKQFESFGLELVNVKHPKEYRFRSQETGNSFIGYKTNYLISLRPSYGREFSLFRKAAEEGVHINFIVAGGPSLGMLKKYYVLYQDFPGSSSFTSIPFTADLELGQINGPGPFSDGLNQMKFTPGFHIKTALSFEFGQIKNSVAGLEVGFLFEQFTRKQELMASKLNSASTSFLKSGTFTSTYLILYFGKKY